MNIDYYLVMIKGKSINRFLSKIYKYGIDVFDINYFESGILIKIKISDYKKILKLNTIYDIKIVKSFGFFRIKEVAKKYKTFLIFFILSLLILYFLSNLVFFIKIDINNLEMKKIIYNELKNNNITLYGYGYSYNKLSLISKSIKNKYSDDIEFFEMKKNGVFLDVSVVLKEKKNVDRGFGYSNIVANDSGYIVDLYVLSGNILKVKGDYVNKGDVIVTGIIKRGDDIVSYTRSVGKCFASVWKKVLVNAPFKYTSSIFNGTYTKYISINLFGTDFTIFKSNSKNESNKKIYNGIFLNIQEKTEKNYDNKDLIYSEEELYNLLYNEAKKKINSLLGEKEYVIKENTLKKSIDSDKMYLEVFFKVYEDIAVEKNIDKKD